jgi:hypothetical protein
MSALSLSLAAYFTVFGFFVILLLPQTRHALREEPWYKNNLNFFLLIRQILLFLFPLWAATVTVGATWVSNQLLTLVALGLSIIIFWIVELPLLMKADILVTFGVDDGNAIAEDDYVSKIRLDPEKENIVNTRVQNLGFTTLKNALVEIYFGDTGLEVVPCDDPRYVGLDFPKRFSIQKTHCGILFTPKDNFQTIPPQEVMIFQTILRKPINTQKGEVIIQFSSESSWGLREIKALIEIIKN